MAVSTNNGLVNGAPPQPADVVFHLVGAGGGGSPKGLVHNLLMSFMQFFTLGSSKIRVFKTYFFDTVITLNDHPRYVKHVVGRIYVFFILFGYWVWVGAGGVRTGLVHNVLMQFFDLGSSKIKVFKTYF